MLASKYRCKVVKDLLVSYFFFCSKLPWLPKIELSTVYKGIKLCLYLI